MHAFNQMILAALSLFAAPVKMALAGAAITSTTTASSLVRHRRHGRA